jgi:hypothetical protein
MNYAFSSKKIMSEVYKFIIFGVLFNPTPYEKRRIQKYKI